MLVGKIEDLIWTSRNGKYAICRIKIKFFRLSRSNILATAAMYGLNETVSRARLEFQKWMEDNQSVNPDFKEVVYSAGVKYGGPSEWQHCWNVYNSTNIPSEKRLMLKALGVSSDPWILQRFMMIFLHLC